ncbi:aspartate/glutamate racemase family protein [Roseateles sp. NT4]|uniref:aspartate/glutamate racemase family protein n=1 Tax=Roseateles sp. NT4 TaxID=3453715 RepID=UPI003EECF4D2
MDVVGVLGGMGPLATIDFMRKVLDATPAARDQDHVPMIVSCLPQIPDRTAAFRGMGDSPLDAIVDCGRRLESAGADLIVMPCNTAHLWFDAVQARLQRPMLHLVDAALREAQRLAGPQARLGLLATDATIASGLYINRHLPGATAPTWLLPTAGEMLEQVMPGIDAVKAGRLEAGQALLTEAAQALSRRGADVLVLACTEIPLVLDAAACGRPVADATAALAREVVARIRPG